MSEFSHLFKKLNGRQQLKQYMKSHVLLLALIETLLLGRSRKSLEIVRLAVQNKVYKRLEKKYASLIHNYVAEHPFSQKTDRHKRIIWTAWLQGASVAPNIVKKCHNSMRQRLPNCEIVVITEENYSKYISFPDYIMEKYRKRQISKVQFSDLIRIELLSKYGGTWLDGTVYCSDFVEEKHAHYLDSDLFLYQIMKPGLDGHSSSVSSWMITASPNQNIILLTRALLYNYWQTHAYAVDYFILHYFLQMSIEAYPSEWKNVIPVSNSLPHILWLRLFDKYDDNVWCAVKNLTPFHKLSYKYDEIKEQISDTYYDKVLNCLQEK